MARFISVFSFWSVMGALLAAVLMSNAAAQSVKPNFVVVLVDDMRWDDFGAGGHPFVQTPNIDRVANEGVLFTNSFWPFPLTRANVINFVELS